MTHLPMRLELADARSRRCQHQPTPGGRPCALRWPRGHTHTRWAWRPSVSRRRPCSLSRPGAQERRCLHATPPSSARRAGSHPGCRAPVQSAVALALRWTLRRHPGWLPALALGQRQTSRLAAAVPAQVVRLGPHRRLDRASTCPAPPAPCSDPTGVGRAYGSAPAPAGAARCPAAAAPTHPPALPSEGGESPSAVTGACHFVCKPRRTASVRCCAPASRPSPLGGLAASLDTAAQLNEAAPAVAASSQGRFP